MAKKQHDVLSFTYDPAAGQDHLMVMTALAMAVFELSGETFADGDESLPAFIPLSVEEAQRLLLPSNGMRLSMAVVRDRICFVEARVVAAEPGHLTISSPAFIRQGSALKRRVQELLPEIAAAAMDALDDLTDLLEDEREAPPVSYDTRDFQDIPPVIEFRSLLRSA